MTLYVGFIQNDFTYYISATEHMPAWTSYNFFVGACNAGGFLVHEINFFDELRSFQV